jgi:hypothetical protein
MLVKLRDVVMLADDVAHQLNEEFSKSKIPIKINQLILFRPVFHEPPFENLEVLNDPQRCVTCNVVHMVINMTYSEHSFEVELRYKNNNGKFENEWCQLMACDVFSKDDMKVLQDFLSEMAKLTGLLVLSNIHDMSEKK